MREGSDFPCLLLFRRFVVSITERTMMTLEAGSLHVSSTTGLSGLPLPYRLQGVTLRDGSLLIIPFHGCTFCHTGEKDSVVLNTRTDEGDPRDRVPSWKMGSGPSRESDPGISSKGEGSLVKVTTTETQRDPT